jgi:hypothetical protein
MMVATISCAVNPIKSANLNACINLSWVGFTWDKTTNNVYLVGYKDGKSILYTLNLNDLTTTFIDTIGEYLMIGIAANNEGILYGIDMINDSLYIIDKTTAQATSVGALGINIAYAQDICIDRSTNTLYGTLYTDHGSLYTINTSTGAATEILNYQDEFTMCALFSTPPTPTQAPVAEADISIYPNPATDFITIDLNHGQETMDLYITDLSGKTVLHEQVRKRKNWYIGHLKPGIYYVRSSQGNIKPQAFIKN